MATTEQLQELGRLQEVWLAALRAEKETGEAVIRRFADCAAGLGTGPTTDELDAQDKAAAEVKAAKDALYAHWMRYHRDDLRHR